MSIFDGNMPYTNLHELNLDWVVKKLKEVENKLEEIEPPYTEYYGKIVNVIEEGVTTDGTNQSGKIQRIINENPNKVIYFPDGEYTLDEPILTSASADKRVVLLLSQYAILKASNIFPVSDFIVKIGSADTFDYNNGVPLGIVGGIIDCNFVASGIKVEHCHLAQIRDMVLQKVSYVGIRVDKRSDNNVSSDAQIENVIVYGQLYNATNTGLLLNGYDNNVNTFRTMHTGKGIVLNGGGNIINDAHVLCSADTMSNYNDTIGFEINSNANMLDDIYADNYSTGLLFKDGFAYYNVINKYFCLWYSATNGKNHSFIGGMFNTNVIKSINGSIASSGDNYIWNYTSTDLGRESQIEEALRGIYIGENRIDKSGYSRLKYQLTDYGNLCHNEKTNYFNGGSLSQGTWIPVGVFVLPTANTLAAEVEVSLGWDTSATILFRHDGVKIVNLTMAGATGRKLDAVITSTTGQGSMFKCILWVRPNFGAEQRVMCRLVTGWCVQYTLPPWTSEYNSEFTIRTSTPSNVVGSIISSQTW